MCTSVHNKSRSHRFPQETFEGGSLAPATESRSPTHAGLPPQHARIPAEPCLPHQWPLLAAHSSRGQREASREDGPHHLRNPSKEAVTQRLEKQWSGSG